MHTTPYSRPSPGTRTAQVWDVADQISRDSGRRANRKEVIARIVAQGGNENTASTQYHHWKAHREAKQSQDAPVARDTPADALEIQTGGVLVLPSEILAAMRAKPGDRVTAKVVDGELTIATARAGVSRLQAIASKYKREGESVVDEFLSERREMWGEE